MYEFLPCTLGEAIAGKWDLLLVAVHSQSNIRSFLLCLLYFDFFYTYLLEVQYYEKIFPISI